jgi:D-sedoheptulose 7-phosphate isomerase
MSALPQQLPTLRTPFETGLAAHRALFERLHALQPEVEQAAELMADTLRRGRKLLFMGNGGSAADCQHLAAEFTGRFLRERAPLAAISLTTDTSALTCIGNDYGFDEVFARQLAGVGQAGDCAIGISTSGRSPNVLRALERARSLGMTTIGLSGRDGGDMRTLCDLCIVVPHPDTARIQEAHIFIGHSWCALVEQALAAAP